MKKTITLLALTITFSMNAQMDDNSANDNSASGTMSVAMGGLTQATGNYGSTAMGYETLASGAISTAMGRSSRATGYASTASGYDSNASGDSSTSMGFRTTASGDSSTAMGKFATASALISTAMGYYTVASGDSSTAMGYYTVASDYASLVIGQYNDSGYSVTNNATSFNTANTAFVIGNGPNWGDRSDAFKVMFNGDAYVSRYLYLGGTKITSTAAELNLLTGVTSIASGILSPVTESGKTGVRLSTSSDANYGDIGSNAVDLSYSISASTTRGATGSQSTAMGDGTTASGTMSVAMGGLTQATGNYGSTAMGYETLASGAISTAMGRSSRATGYASTASGYDSNASGDSSTSMGFRTTASGDSSTAMGKFATASALISTAMGYYTVASGDSSTAMGYYTVASDYASLVIGQYNDSGYSVTNNATSFNTANTAFVIGNGPNWGDRSDAFKVMFNGDATIGNDLTVSGDVVVSSDARLKANIVSLGATLAKLLLIDGKSYTMKKDGKQKIGVLAQDIQKVFPELVSTDDRDMLAVNYQGLVPVLINALKEQDAKMKEQQADIDELKVMVKQLMLDK